MTAVLLDRAWYFLPLVLFPLLTTALFAVAPVATLLVRAGPPPLLLERTWWGVRARRGRSRIPLPPDWTVDWPRWWRPGAVRIGGEEHAQISGRGAWLGAGALTLAVWAMVLVAAGQLIYVVPVIGPDGELRGRRIVAPLAFGASARAPLGDCAVTSGRTAHALVDWGGRRYAFDTGAEFTVALDHALGHLSRWFQGPLVSGKDGLRGFGDRRAEERMRFASLADAPACGGRATLLVMRAAMPVEFDGFLGVEPFLGRVVELDLVRQRFVVDADLRGARSRHRWLEGEGAALLGGALDVEVSGHLGDRAVRVAIDTGADGTTVRSGLALAPVLPDDTDLTFWHQGGVGVQGETGRQQLLRAERLCFGGVCVEDWIVERGRVPAGADVNLGVDALWGRVLVLDLIARRVWIGPMEGVPAGVVTQQAAWRSTIASERPVGPRRP